MRAVTSITGRLPVASLIMYIAPAARRAKYCYQRVRMCVCLFCMSVRAYISKNILHKMFMDIAVMGKSDHDLI